MIEFFFIGAAIGILLGMIICAIHDAVNRND